MVLQGGPADRGTESAVQGVCVCWTVHGGTLHVVHLEHIGVRSVGSCYEIHVNASTLSYVMVKVKVTLEQGHGGTVA
jgi:hypothetical protein